jgi:hypothetical protein
VDQALNLLSAKDAATAEAMILPGLPGKTYAQAEKLAAQAALTVDPQSAARRRKDAEQHRSRVELSREPSGAAALSGRDLPTGPALAAHASVCARAQQYKESGAFPDDTQLDQFRVAAYLDLMNDITAETRIASGQLPTDTASPEGDTVAEASAEVRQATAASGSPTPPTAPTPPRLANLVLPLATLLGLAERPGEGHGLGPLDPDLCRDLAIAAAASPWTQFCVTVTDQDGIAIGHGCARRAGTSNSGALPVPGLPARVNLTIPAARLPELTAAAAHGPPSHPPWSFTPDDVTGPPGNSGTWTLTLPNGRRLTVHLGPLPTFDCDHRHESHAYQPSDTLRHLVQIRDYECTFPPCSRHARESDFEHALPYDKGGRTCACNAGARSRACHQVKQSPGWTVTQPKPGWHQWATPSGRTYTQAPKHYPA